MGEKPHLVRKSQKNDLSTYSYAKRRKEFTLIRFFALDIYVILFVWSFWKYELLKYMFVNFYSFCLYDRWIFDLCKLLSASIFLRCIFLFACLGYARFYTPPKSHVWPFTKFIEFSRSETSNQNFWGTFWIGTRHAVAGRLELNSRHEGLKQKPLIPNSDGTLRLEQQETTEQLKHRGLKQQMG